MQAYLILANGRVFRGVSVGCPGTTIEIGRAHV